MCDKDTKNVCYYTNILARKRVSLTNYTIPKCVEIQWLVICPVAYILS